ncbi:MAG: sulfite exporter TauE/SafE family protein [bacterium]
MSNLEIIALMLSACAAGMINAVAGGGTLVTFPVLILFGVPPVIANATSTLSLVVGTAGSIYGFRRNIAEVRPWFKTFIPISLIGGWLGSFLLTHGKESTFSHLVPYLVLFATLLFMLQGVVRRSVAHQVVLEGRHSKSSSQVRFHLIGAMIFQFFVSIYGGYFGAGIGILMLATLGFLGFSDIHKMNTLKNVIGSLINLVAAIWFTASGLINWPIMGVMTVGAVTGYYLGATYSQKLSQEKARYLITAIGLIITIVMFWKLH